MRLILEGKVLPYIKEHICTTIYLKSHKFLIYKEINLSRNLLTFQQDCSDTH